MKNKFYFIVAILLVVGLAHAHSVTMNFAARIGTNDTIWVNDTDYNSSSFTFNSLQYASINNTNTLAAIVSPSDSSVVVNGSYYRDRINSSLIALHLDNSTLDANGINNGTINGNVSCDVAGKIDGAC